MKQIINPTIVGRINETKVQNLLFVSFFIVNIVVLHGKWNKVNISIQIAVMFVHPLFISKVFNSIKLL